MYEVKLKSKNITFFSLCPGEDWECQLDESESKSSNIDDDGVNNLSYLREQVKGYNPDDNGQENLSNDDNPTNDDENVLITMSNNGTMTFESNSASNASVSENMETGELNQEFESSGDGIDTNGENDIDRHDDLDLENKSGYGSMPSSSSGIVATQLQRLAQLIKKVNYDQNSNHDLTPDELNQFLALHKLKYSQNVNTNANAEPVPHDNFVKEHHLQQILDLQKKLNRLALTRNRLSTPAPPVKFSVTNGFYPADATTVHIKATNAIKNPEFPDLGYTSSQIVVNRPGGSVVFKLPHSNYAQNNDKQGPQISEETLKTLLELSKQMVNQAPNTPNFVHSLPNNGYVQPIIQPVVYGLPWDHMSMQSGIMSSLDTKKPEKSQNEQNSMEKITSVNSNVPSESGDDGGTTTVVHNHIPITISHPNPSKLFVNRNPIATTTQHPYLDRYDSYGNERPFHQTDLNNYYPYPPFPENYNKNPSMQQISSTFSTNPTAFSPSNNYGANLEQPEFIQISQSRPENHYIAPVFPNNMNMMNNMMRPIPTYASVDGGYTQKIYSPHTPQPYLSDGNVNDYVPIDRKPYPTIKPTNYVPIASDPAPTYANVPSAYRKKQRKPSIRDKIDDFIEENEPSENKSGESNEQYDNNDDYVNPNVEQNNNDDDDVGGGGNDDNNNNNDSNGNENVMDLLANYNLQTKTTPESMVSIGNSVEPKPTNQYKTLSDQSHKQFVNLNGNIMSLETYQQTIEPFIQKNSEVLSQIEVITCAKGVRQANSTDCTKYFVCNDKNGKILSYSCPPYTAFNPSTKICNADTYSQCLTNVVPTSAMFGGGKIGQQKLQQTLIEANRLKSEAVKAHQLAHLIRLQTNKILNSNRLKQQQINDAPVQIVRPTKSAQVPQRPNRKPSSTNKVTSHKQSTRRPAKPQGKRKIPCKQEGKLVDNLSPNHYFLCFKDQTKTMRARRLQCPAKLVFCSATLVCTASERCSSN